MSSPRREPLPFWLLALCFIGSGFTALAYELIWTRRLGLTFGSTTASVTTVLAAFMGGLGLGSYLWGRVADRSRLGGARLYALLELAVGLYALVSLPLLGVVESLYAWLQRSLALGQTGGNLLKLVLAFPLLALPAGLMGGTLPALARALVRSRDSLHAEVGRLYGLNTVGAAAGTLCTGLLLIELLGLTASVRLAAALNLTIGLLILNRLRVRAGEGDPSPAEAAPRDTLRLREHLRSSPVLFAAASVVLTGFLSMLYEIVWTRLLILLVGSSSYAFTVVLAVFLLGISLGALLYARIDRQPGVARLTLLLLTLAAWVLCTHSLLPWLPELLARVGQIPGGGWQRLLLCQVLLACFVLFFPTLLLGAALPMSMGIIARGLGRVGSDIGGVYLANTAGAIAGSVLTGFLLLPWLGSRGTLLAGVLCNLALVAVGFLGLSGAGARRAAGLVVTALLFALAVLEPPWPPHLLDGGMGLTLGGPPVQSARELAQRITRSPGRLLFLEEGVNATVSVRQGEQVSLIINGKADASTGADMVTQVMLGAIPMLLHPSPVEVGVVGHGSGVTAQVVTLFPEATRIDVVEIERAVLRASPLFAPFNGNVERHPRVRLHHDDARSYFLTTPARYDVIISEPSNPWTVGSALFSREHYQICRTRLKPGGLFGQWLQLYSLDARSVALVLRTMLESFADVQVWATDPGNLLVIGSDRPIRFSPSRAARAYAADRRLPAYLAAFGPGARPERLPGAYLLGRRAVEQVCRRFGDEPLSDDEPVLEFWALRALNRGSPDHLLPLLRAKQTAGDWQPPSTESLADEAERLAGLMRLCLTAPPLAESVGAWSLRRLGPRPALLVGHAATLARLGRAGDALRLLGGLPAELDGELREEALLLEANLLVGAGRPQEARALLPRLGDRRRLARLRVELATAARLGELDRAWTAAEALVPRLDELDADALTLDRGRLYRELESLARRSRDWQRGLRLLRPTLSRTGDLQRLGALARLAHAAGEARRAAAACDELLRFGLLDAPELRVCASSYRAAGEESRAAECRRQLESDAPLQGRPLWPGQGLD